MQGGSFPNFPGGGSAGFSTTATGTYNIPHQVGTVRTCGAIMALSRPDNKDQQSCRAYVRVSGTVLVVKIASRGNTLDQVTVAGYWWAIA
jgi:hypothetical protein